MPPDQTPTTPAANAAPLKAKTILSIEDEEFISELYARALTKAGYQVTIEHDGKAGLALAQTDRYDIVLLDLLLPTMHGAEVLKQLRDPVKTPHFHSKVIIMTNFEERQEVRSEIERLADAYIVKIDITPNGLVEFLKQIK
ncbi:MAG TPA: response regulator [Candidatus Binatia bacterium]|jgi:DNA-binding response OmpR family regulator|nr:response regulator [Candidatus Binatia bacterium]